MRKNLHRSRLLTGFVLAGGESRRMGSPKGLLLPANETMLCRQLRLLRTVAANVAVAGIRPEYPPIPGVQFLPDVQPGRGPLAGIASALQHTRTEYNLFLGCDLPFITAGLLAHLSQRAFETGADALVPKSLDGRIQPLCAVYRRRARWAVQLSLDSGQNKVMSFYSKIHAVVLPWRDLARAGFHASIFANMNTPEDYEVAKRRLNAVTSDK